MRKCSRVGLRSKAKALTRAVRLVDEGDAKVAKLSAQASELESTSARTNARIVELKVRTLGVCECVPGTEDGRGLLESQLRIMLQRTRSTLGRWRSCRSSRVWVLKVETW